MNLRRTPMFIGRLSCALLLTATLPVTAAADQFDTIRERIRQQLVEQSIPSLAVAVARDGRIVWEEGFGWADRERRQPATEHTMYSLASISKPITTTGLMALVRDGKIDLDRPINDYFGKAQLQVHLGDPRKATVRSVANHTAGLSQYVHFFYADEPYARPPMDETILRYGVTVTPPGERFEYSNLGYGLLDYVISRASGLSYPEFMRREVFLPLGMTRTSVDIGPGLEPYAAMRYATDGTPLPFYDFDHPGGSAVFASAHDLVRFGMFHLKNHLPDQKAILSDAQIDAMHRSTASRTGAAGSGKLPGYSAGFFIDDSNGYRVVSHSGGMPGVATQLVLVPEKNIAIVALSNSGNGLPLETAQSIAKLLLPDWKPSPPRTPRQAVPPFVTPKQLLGTWQGVVATHTGDVAIELTFQADGDVHAKLGDQPMTLVNEPQFENGDFSGVLGSRLGTPDAVIYNHVIDLTLTLRGDKLTGAASVNSISPNKSSPKQRNFLAHWAELRHGKRAPARQ